MNVSSTDDHSRRFREQAWPWLASLLRVARLLTRSPHQAEDLVQETMLRAYRHFDRFQPGTNMRAWLMTILRRTHIDMHRREHRHTQVDSLDAMGRDPDASPPPDEADWTQPEQLLEQFDDEAIESALRSLPQNMRWTLLLLDVEQLSVDETAEVLDVAPGTVKSRASRARALLREALLPEAKRRGWLSPDDVGDVGA